MKARVWLVGVGCVAAVLGGTAAVKGRTILLPPRGEPCPPAGRNCCLIQLHKRFQQGTRRADPAARYLCGGTLTWRGVATVELKLGTARRCDEQPRLIPDGSRLRARGNLIRRKDGLAQFCGTFTLLNPAGRTIASGMLETLDRVGSHSGDPGVPQCENCAPEEHLEGWIAGHGSGPLANRYLRAVIVAHVKASDANGTSATLDGGINGVVIDCAQHTPPVR